MARTPFLFSVSKKIDSALVFWYVPSLALLREWVNEYFQMVSGKKSPREGSGVGLG